MTCTFGAKIVAISACISVGNAALRQEFTMLSGYEQNLEEDTRYPANYYTEQTLDHFEPSDRRVFKQKYFANFDHYQPGGPIFLIIGGEGPLSSSLVSERKTSAYFAKQFSGGTVALEHRFYGESQPFESLSVEHLQYLTSRQALHDLAQFQLWLKNIANQTLKNSSFFCIGGSYPGNLAAWYRLEFPDLTAGCWSASAPVHAVEDWPGFGEMVWRAMSTDAYGNKDMAPAVKLFAGYEQLAALIQDPTAASVAQVEKMLNACPGSLISQDDRDNWEMTITNYPGLIMQYNNTASTHLADLKQVVESAETPLQAAFAATKFMNVTRGRDGKCVDFSIGSFYRKLGNITLPHTGVGNALRTWTWQTCNEFGYFQTARANLERPNFYTRGTNSRALWQRVCSEIFGVPESSIGARIAKTNSYYGGKNPPGISNVFFSNGELDAWSLLSVTEYPSNQRAVSAMVAPLGSHCVGLAAPGYDGGLPGAAQVRNRAFEHFTEWNAVHKSKKLDIFLV